MRRIVAGFVAASILLIVATTGAHARATLTPYEFTVTDVESGRPDRVWISDGILHIRGLPVKTVITGDIVGTADTIRNVNVDLSTGDAEAWGTFVRSVTWQGLSGTFEGHFTAKVIDGATVVRLVGHGSGAFDGMHHRDVLHSVEPGVNEGGGIILDPHG